MLPTPIPGARLKFVETFGHMVKGELVTVVTTSEIPLAIRPGDDAGLFYLKPDKNHPGLEMYNNVAYFITSNAGRVWQAAICEKHF